MQLSDDVQHILDLTQDLMRIPSTAAHPEAIAACADTIAEYISALGVRPERFSFNGVPCVAALPKERYAPVLLMAHFDVVAADSEEQFTPVIKDGNLYGRGSIDDKYAVAMSLTLFKKHLEAIRTAGGSLADMPFGLLFTGDEERGGHDGAGKVLRRISTDFSIAIDGGAPQRVVTKGKGILDVRLTTHGTAAHGARPWLGESAFDLLVEDYAALKALFPMGDDDAHWHRTMNFGIVRAGKDAANKVPGTAEAIIDIRYTEHDDVDDLLAQMAAATHGTIDVLAREPMFYAGTSPYLDLLRAQNPGLEAEFAHGASDARFLTDSGVPAVIWGAQGEMSQHGPNEHLCLDSLQNLTDRLDAFLSEAASIAAGKQDSAKA